MSPNMFSVTMTSNCCGVVASCIAALSTSMCSTLTSGNSGAISFDHAPPHARRLEDVRLVDRRQRTAPRLRERERPPRNARDLVGVVLARVEHRSVVADAARAEVETADELAHDEHVDVAEDGGAQVRVRVERRAQAQQPLLGPHVRSVELGIADRALQDRGRSTTRSERVLGQGISDRADCGGADEPFLHGDIGRDKLENEARFMRDLRPDSVAGQEHNGWARHPGRRSPQSISAGGHAGAA